MGVVVAEKNYTLFEKIPCGLVPCEDEIHINDSIWGNLLFLTTKTGNLSCPFLLLYIKILMKEAARRIGLSFSQKSVSNEKNLSFFQKTPFRFCLV